MPIGQKWAYGISLVCGDRCWKTESPWSYERLLFWTVVWMLLLLLQHKRLAELKSALMTCWFGSAWILQQFIWWNTSHIIVVLLNSRSLRFSTFHPIMVRFTRKPQNWARSESRSSACVLSVGTLQIWHLKPVTASSVYVKPELLGQGIVTHHREEINVGLNNV